MSKAPRINDMLREFRDSTASIYFVPDIFAFDLVQARCVEVNGIPMLSICDTPFHGMQAVRKRATDIALAALSTGIHLARVARHRDRSQGLLARPGVICSNSAATA